MLTRYPDAALSMPFPHTNKANRNTEDSRPVPQPVWVSAVTDLPILD